MAVAVSASTLTTLIVFLPLIVGAKVELTVWLGEIGMAIAIALACSLFSALTLIPLMSAYFLGQKKPKPVKSIAWLEEKYSSILAWTLHHRVKTLGLIVLGLGVGLLPFFTGMVESAVFSGTVNSMLRLRYEFADHTYKSEAEDVVDVVEAVLEENRERVPVRVPLQLLHGESCRDDPGARATGYDRRGDQGSAAGDPRGAAGAGRGAASSSTTTRKTAATAPTSPSSSLARTPEFWNVSPPRRRGGSRPWRGSRTCARTFRDAQQEIQVTIDREKAERLGLTAQDLADIFSFTLGSMRLPRFNTGQREVETWLALRLEDRENLDDLKKIQIGGGDGVRPFQLGDIADSRSFHDPGRSAGRTARSGSLSAVPTKERNGATPSRRSPG